MPSSETCSFDPGSGFSHCDTRPSETENKITVTLWLAVPDLVMLACGPPEPVALTYLAGEATYDAYEWGTQAVRVNTIAWRRMLRVACCAGRANCEKA